MIELAKAILSSDNVYFLLANNPAILAGSEMDIFSPAQRLTSSGDDSFSSDNERTNPKDFNGAELFNEKFASSEEVSVSTVSESEFKPCVDRATTANSDWQFAALTLQRGICVMSYNQNKEVSLLLCVLRSTRSNSLRL